MPPLSVLLLTFLLCSGISSCAERPIGSTRHLKGIVLGRCWDFLRQKGNNLSEKNCSKLWDAFYTAFAYKDPCNTTFADYGPYFDEVGMDIVKPNKSLFWSGTYKEAHVLSDFDARFTTLEDTMAGWIVNGLRWCGSQKSGSDGINYSSCPQSCDYSTPFWGEASSRFAARASGVVRVLLNGTRINSSGNPIPTYRNESYFAKFELPNMRKEMVTKLLILVVHSIAGAELEKCGYGSINLLQEEAKQHGIKTICYDDPDDIEHLLCTDHPTSPECLFLKNKRMKKETQSNDCDEWKILAIVQLVIVAVFLIGAVVRVVINKTKACPSPFAYERQD